MSADCLDLLLAPDSPAPSPCFVLDECRLAENAAILDGVQKATGAKILLALKGFAAWATFPLLSRAGSGPLWGVCASSVDEARLGREDFGGEVHAFAAAWSEEEFRELLTLCDHIVFNSVAQWRRFRPVAEAARAAGKSRDVSFGLRLNPEHSEGAVPSTTPARRVRAWASARPPSPASSRQTRLTAFPGSTSIRCASRGRTRLSARSAPWRKSSRPG